jgi:hypothetical protein
VVLTSSISDTTYDETGSSTAKGYVVRYALSNIISMDLLTNRYWNLPPSLMT